MKKRKSPRWANWDYSTEGYYFVTAVTKDRLKLFGNIVLDEFIEMRNIADVGTGLRPVPTFYPMILNEYGKIVLECWNDLPNRNFRYL
jgi:hypothetical protein